MASFTMLNAMASEDIAESLNVQRAWGIHELDLKDSVFGKTISALSELEAERLKRLIEDNGQHVYCLSTEIFHEGIHESETDFLQKHSSSILQTIRVAKILNPSYVRILPCKLDRKTWFDDSLQYIDEHCPWLYQIYQEVIDRFADISIPVLIENECDSIFSSADEILAFFNRLNRFEQVHLTYDVQNLWQMGTYPSLEVYQQLKPVLAYLHLKGGVEDPDTGKLKWKSSLEDASWPVEDIVIQALKDGVSPVICLNPSHGAYREGYDYEGLPLRDLRYLESLASQFTGLA